MFCSKTKTMLHRFFAVFAVIAFLALFGLAISFAPPAKAVADDVARDGSFDHASAVALSEFTEKPGSGSYYLTDDIVMTETWELYSDETINLCLHGHTITALKQKVLGAYGSGVFNIYDCGGDGETCGAVSGGKGVYLYNGGTLNLYGGAIQNAEDYAGVTVSGNAVFNMYDGEIKGCTSSSSDSSGVWIGSSGTFNMYGGSIHDNTTGSYYGGGGVYLYGTSATFHMYGGEIKNNVIDALPRFFEGNHGGIVYTKKVTEEDLQVFYKGAGVNATSGTFTMEGDVVITGNYRISEEGEKISNVEVDDSNKINITGQLGNNSRIGITAPNGAVFTSGYADAGNTKKPSEFFIPDDNTLMVGYDTLHKEAAITDDDGEYNMVNATVSTPPTATVGDTEIKLSVSVTLENVADGSTKTMTDLVTMNLSSPITSTNKPTSYDYKYTGASGVQTQTLSFTVDLQKYITTVSWTLPDSVTTGLNSAEIDYSGSDILSSITARYDGYDGNQKTVSGSAVNFTIVDDNGNIVSSAVEVGTYRFSLKTSANYEFYNNAFIVTIGKYNTAVSWTLSGGVTTGTASAKIDYSGSDILSAITARYTGYDGVQKVVDGSSGNIAVTDGSGNTVSSAVEVGMYKFALKPSADYEFSSNLFTVTIEPVGSVDDGYYQLHSATVIGVKGTPTAGDKNITVIIQRTLKHTADEPDKTESVDYSVTVSTALHGGDNDISFTYSYTDANGGVQTKPLNVTVPAAKKTVTVSWYFYDAVAAGNAATHVYDGADVGNKIVAVYDGIDGSKQRVNASSPLMVREDENGNTVSSLSEVGMYTVYLADSTDYTFEHNAFTFSVVEDLSAITDLVYVEEGKTVLGVSSESGFDDGTELAVEEVECDPNLVNGEIATALNVTFVKDSQEVTPTGSMTVHVVIPENLRDGTEYKIYNLKNGVANEMQYRTEGPFAIFDADDLGCIMFVTPKAEPPAPTKPANPKQPTGSDLTWLWIFLPVFLVATGIIIAVVIIKSNRKQKSSDRSDGEKK